MDEDAFNVTLSSNIERTYDPNNKPAKFVTRLAKSIELTGEWEVAATRLQFENNWRTEIEGQVLGVYVRDVSTIGSPNYVPNMDHSEITGPTRSGADGVRRAALIRSSWAQEPWSTGFSRTMNYRLVNIPGRKYASIEELGRAVCAAINEAFRFMVPPLHVRYSYQFSRKMVQISPAIRNPPSNDPYYAVRIVTMKLPNDSGENLMEALGFIPGETGEAKDAQGRTVGTYNYYGNPVIPSATAQAMMSRITMQDECSITAVAIQRPRLPVIRQLLLYSDVGAYRLVGDARAQLLDTVVVSSAFGEAEDALRGTRPNYVAVHRKSIDTIEIRITDHTGADIEFTNPYSPVSVTLQFRRVRRV